MSDAHSSLARRIGAAGLLAALVVAAVLAAQAPWAPAGAGEPAATDAAPQCSRGSGISVNDSVDALISETMRDLSERGGAAGSEAESEWVVLNNRGFNYGPPPGVSFDPELDLPAPN